jgi:hypothetical protein
VADDEDCAGGFEGGYRAENVGSEWEAGKAVQHFGLPRCHPFAKTCRKDNYCERLALHGLCRSFCLVLRPGAGGG